MSIAKVFCFIVALIAAANLHAAASKQLHQSPSSSDCANVFPRLNLGPAYAFAVGCTNAGGCWDDSMDEKCYAPNVSGYAVNPNSVKQTTSSYEAQLTLNKPSGLFGLKSDFQSVRVSIVKESSSRTHVKFTPLSPSGKALSLYEVPESLIPRPSVEGGANSLSSNEIESVLELAKTVIYQEQYIQMVFQGPKDSVATYGFGESTRAQQALEFDTHYTLWNSDYWAAGFNASLYGSHPFFMQVRSNGDANGILFLNSNAIEATIYRSNSDPAFPNQPLVGVQSSGGIIDLYMFSGPSPVEVVKQLQEVIGKPSMLPYWSLGLHNCRWGYENLQYVEDVVANYSAASIPLETQWMDIDYMQDYKDFTTDAVKFPADGMKAFVDRLHENGQRWVPIIDPGIYAVQPTDGSATYPALKDGLDQNVFMKGLDGKPYLGQVWPGSTYFPDWFATNTSSWWENQLNEFHKLVPYDGIWIDMNEVSNFCNENGKAQVCDFDPGSTCPNGCCLSCKTTDPTNKYDFPAWYPHVSKGTLGTKTVPMSVTHENGLREYDTHNLFGLMESVATQKALSNIIGEKRTFVLSRSTYLSSGRHTAHWTGDNAATWDDLKASIVTMNNFALFGQPNTGADICGFAKNTNEELCARWISVGSFSVFTRDHNEIGAIPQELYRWDSVADASRNALSMKYRLLPYLNTLLYRATTDGATVHNSMWLHYPSDPKTFSINSQFMWSNGILFTPVLESGTTTVTGYFPKGIWYPLFNTDTHGPIDASSEGQVVTLATPLTATNAHVRGGVILPMQGAAMTTREARKSPFSLLVALDANKSAKGEVFLDDGEQAQFIDYAVIDFTFCPVHSTLFSKVQTNTIRPAMKESVVASTAVLGEVAILGWGTAECDAILSFEEKKDIAIQLKNGRVDLTEHGISILSEFSVQLLCK